MSKIENFKVNKSISRNGFIGFIIMALFTFLMEFVFAGDGVVQIPPWVKYGLYVIGMAVIVIFGVDKPEMRKFLSTVQEALSDGKITGDEAVAMIRSAWFMLLGFWADVEQVNEAGKKEEELKKLKAEYAELTKE